MKLFAALREDTQQGWVWIKNSSILPRSIIKIQNSSNGKSIYCEASQIDQNFLKNYNQAPRREISDPENSIVINGWFRHLLGNLSTNSEAHIKIESSNSWFGKFRACTHHPQVVVRVAAWLGLISVGLGFIGVILGMISLVK